MNPQTSASLIILNVHKSPTLDSRLEGGSSCHTEAVFALKDCCTGSWQGRSTLFFFPKRYPTCIGLTAFRRNEDIPGSEKSCFAYRVLGRRESQDSELSYS